MANEDFDVEAYLDAGLEGKAMPEEKNDDRRDRSERERSSHRRSHSHRRKHRHRDRDEDRHRNRRHHRDRHSRRRSRSRSRSYERYSKRSRSPTPEAEKQLRAQKRELDEITRDARTVFIGQLQARATHRDVKKFFETVSKVRDVRMITDKFTRRSKGFGYVELATLEDVPKALVLNGQRFIFKDGSLGFPVLVKASEAEKNYAAQVEAAAAAAAKKQESNMMKRLYVGNLHVNVGEEDLRTVFEPFGRLDRVDMHYDEGGHSKGYAFVHFMKGSDGAKAMARLNGLELAGKPLKVGVVNESSGIVNNDNTNWRLEDDDGDGGLLLGAQHRAVLMAKLSNGMAMPTPVSALPLPAIAAQAPAPVVVPPTKTPVMGSVSRCVQLKNMFDPALESDEGWDLDIREDVSDECSKHGTVLHIHVDKQSLGHVYLMLTQAESATAVAKALNGRFFAGKMISVAYIPESDYLSRFPSARRAASGAAQQ